MITGNAGKLRLAGERGKINLAIERALVILKTGPNSRRTSLVFVLHAQEAGTETGGYQAGWRLSTECSYFNPTSIASLGCHLLKAADQVARGLECSINSHVLVMLQDSRNSEGGAPIRYQT